MSLKPAVGVARALIVLSLLALTAPRALAEEGLWTFDAFPSATVERTLGVRVGPEWLGHVLAGSVRLTTGCSGALVSPHGLVMTNEHCVLACAQSLSDDTHDHVAGGYGVGDADEERPCPGLQAEILVGIADITGAVFKASAGKTGDDFVKARESLLAQAERVACRGDRRYRCQVISFFGGGQFKVYKYRRYQDVRLVFAPEFGVAFFGGDPENFTFPRYDLDVAALLACLVASAADVRRGGVRVRKPWHDATRAHRGSARDAARCHQPVAPGLQRGPARSPHRLFGPGPAPEAAGRRPPVRCGERLEGDPRAGRGPRRSGFPGRPPRR
jgi:hypothetical protein